MANPTYLLVTHDPDNPDLDQSRILTSDVAVSNIQLIEAGAPGEGSYNIDTVYNLGALAGISSTGLIAVTNATLGANAVATRAITSTGSLTITNPGGVGGNIIIDAVDSTSTQKVNVEVGGVSSGAAQSTLNFIPGNGISISASVNTNQYDITVNALGDGNGTVTSVNAATNATGVTFTGGPITTSGTLTLNFPTSGAAVNKVLGITNASPLTLGWISGGGGGSVSGGENDWCLWVGELAEPPATNVGDPDILIGKLVGTSTSTGGANVCVGVSCFQHLSSGANNTAMGSGCMDAITTGANNTGMGYNALATNLVGSYNTAFGREAAMHVSGSRNTAMGSSALLAATSSVDNTAMGFSCIAGLVGDKNTGVGSGALFGAGAGTTLTTAMGFNAGVSRALYTNCTLLGALSDCTTTGLTNATAVGYLAQVATDNSLVLGADVNVGIGTDSPTHGLHLGVPGLIFKPEIYFSVSGSIPSTPAGSDNVLYNLGGQLCVVSGNADFTGALVSSKSSGSNATAGDALITGGSVTVNSNALQNTSVIILTYRNHANSTGLLPLNVVDVNTGASPHTFTISGSDAVGGQPNVYWQIINPTT